VPDEKKRGEDQRALRHGDENVYGAKPAPEKVVRLGLVRAKGFLYLLDAELTVLRAARDPDTDELAEPELVQRIGHVREAGWFYFLDADGDLARLPPGGR
jgi:hypothetical protein